MAAARRDGRRRAAPRSGCATGSTCGCSLARRRGVLADQPQRLPARAGARRACRTISVSYWAFAGPALLWVGARPARLAARRPAARPRPRPIRRALRPLAGEPRRHGRRDACAGSAALLARGVALVALAVAFAASTAVFNATYRQQAEVDAGSPTAPTSPSPSRPARASDPAGRRGSPRSPGVEHVEPMQHRFAYVGADLQDLYGVDPATIVAAAPAAGRVLPGRHRATSSSRRWPRSPTPCSCQRRDRHDFQLRPGDRSACASRTGAPSSYVDGAVPLRGRRQRSSRPRPRDSFLVANADYVARATGSDAVGAFLVDTGGTTRGASPTRLRGTVVGTAATVTDIAHQPQRRRLQPHRGRPRRPDPGRARLRPRRWPRPPPAWCWRSGSPSGAALRDRRRPRRATAPARRRSSGRGRRSSTVGGLLTGARRGLGAAADAGQGAHRRLRPAAGARSPCRGPTSPASSRWRCSRWPSPCTEPSTRAPARDRPRPRPVSRVLWLGPGRRLQAHLSGCSAVAWHIGGMRILVVEDEKRLAGALKRGLEAEGFAVDVALDGDEGLWLATESDYDAIVLDIMLPGHERLQGVRRVARGGQLDADPHAHRQGRRARRGRGARHRRRRLPDQAVLATSCCVARICAPLLRRGSGSGRPSSRPATSGSTRPRTAAGAARSRSRSRRGSSPCSSSSMRRAGEVVSKSEILEHVWDYAFEGDPNIVEVYVRHLRKKIDEPFDRKAIADRSGSSATASTPTVVSRLSRRAGHHTGPHHASPRARSWPSRSR